jgi:acetate CoA/acetoacetate CoA-transferase beta subunit
MEHTSKDEIKIVKKCNLPLTAYKQVDLIITEKCVFEVGEGGLTMTEINPLFSLDDVKATTGTDFHVSKNLKNM